MKDKESEYYILSYQSPPNRGRWRRRVALCGALFTILALAAVYFFGWVHGRSSLALLGYGTEGSHPILPPFATDQRQPSSTVKLKHVLHHNTREDRNHGRLDVSNEFRQNLLLTATAEGDEDLSSLLQDYTLTKSPKHIRRLADRDPDFVESYLTYARTTVGGPRPMEFNWADDQVHVPNLREKDTMLSLAIMAANAYVELPHTGNWVNLTDPWNHNENFGWMGDGIRGHIFSDDSNSTVIISLKGTSAAVFDSGGDTAPNDKVNDNLLFSCCCARISYLWNTVCDCYTDSYTCNQTCLERNLYREDRYYKASLDLYRNVTALYPDSEIWMVGHSLGGALSALIGRTYGVPAVAFEAPPERLAAERLHLPMPPGVPPWEDYVYHVGHTADPIYMGICNGAGSSCWVGGYAMETQCHTGLKCVYDVVNDKGWHVSMLNHRILSVIENVIKDYNTTPECRPPPPCKDCFNWNFIDDEAPEPAPSTPISTTTSSTTTKTSPTSSPPPTSTKPPQKCLKRTWYGRCIEYGPDVPETTTTASPTSTGQSKPKTATSSAPSTPTPTCPPDETTCLRRSWYGWCLEYGCE